MRSLELGKRVESRKRRLWSSGGAPGETRRDVLERGGAGASDDSLDALGGFVVGSGEKVEERGEMARSGRKSGSASAVSTSKLMPLGVAEPRFRVQPACPSVGSHLPTRR